MSTTSLTKIDNLTTKELYLIATLLANKYLIDEGEDEQLFNSELADLTGIKTERINYIERQVLVALNWDLYISNDEYQEFFTLFKSQIARKLHKNIEQISTEDSIKFYNLCFKLLPQFIEYLTLTSLVLLGSTLSILTAIHIGTMTHSTLMKTINPTIDCIQSSNCYWNINYRDNTNTSVSKQNYFNQPSWKFPIDFPNDTTENIQSTKPIFDLSSCSIELLQPNILSRPLVQTFG